MLKPEDVPFLPLLRQVYWINGLILWSGDREANRPVVIVELPAYERGMIKVVKRTSDLRAPGVQDPPRPELGLRKPGVFTQLGNVEPQLWTPRNTELTGVLPQDVFELLLDRFLS